ncbi:MAG: hypothetical protein ISR65_09985 [Bacteriovoracaceae bacterium]|nr:hypothetical protein [Bacteriovoracaceae bacterium]
MKLNKEVYFCTKCQKVITSFEDVYFVESESSKGFCSEGCIEHFYRPYCEHFNSTEKQLRSNMGLLNEQCLSVLIQKPLHLDFLVKNPNEIWCMKNELNELVYSFITLSNDVYYIGLSLAYETRPSFLFLSTATQNMELLNEFRIGSEIVDKAKFTKSTSSNGKMYIDDNDYQYVESKKSLIMAQILQQRSPTDIPFEKFHLYEEFFEVTLTGADEIYEHQDDTGDLLYTYIKSFYKQGISFYYYVICLNLSGNEVEQNCAATIAPIVSFPSLDGQMYRSYNKGKLISGTLKN